MNIPPILERLLLSNEAEFKNAALGFNSMNMLKVPEGKTAVILGYEVNAFSNAYLGAIAEPIWEQGYSPDLHYETFFSILVQRLLFQVQIVNDKYFTAFTHFPDFTTSCVKKSAGETAETIIQLNFKKQGHPCFIYIDRPIYFQFTFQIQEFFIPYYDFFSVSFTPITQSVPGVPITFNGSPLNQNFFAYQATADALGAGEVYNPLTYAQGNPTLYSGYGLPTGEQEYLRFGTNPNLTGLQNPYIIPGDAITPGTNFNMPTINVQYVLINKRASDYGIFAPK